MPQTSKTIEASKPPDKGYKLTDGQGRIDKLCAPGDVRLSHDRYRRSRPDCVPVPDPMTAVLATRTRPMQLARAMGLTQKDMTRLLDLHHKTKIDTLARAFVALGLELELQVHAPDGVAQAPTAE